MTTTKTSLIQYWDQPNPPDIISERMWGWRQQHPSWRYQRFGRDSAAAFIDNQYGPSLGEAFLDIRLPAMQADVFRIAFVLSCGGLWVDAATTCLSPVETWMDAQAPLLLLRKPHQEPPTVWNGFIYAALPGHPLLQQAWTSIADSILHRRGTGVHKLVGPGLLRDLLAGGRFDAMTVIYPSQELQTHLRIGSSSKVLPAEQHWSQRQRNESLYFSDG